MSNDQKASTINNIECDIWQQLQRAGVDKHHEWRSPVLVTNGLADDENKIWPEARTVILRSVNLSTKQLVFYTDSRSPKVTQLLANPNAMLVFWSKRLNWQLRIKVTFSVQTEGELVQKTWVVVKQSPSAGDYLSVQAPGETLLQIPALHTQAEKNNAQIAKPCFALLTASVIEIDWLALNRAGHQRAKIDAHGYQTLAP